MRSLPRTAFLLRFPIDSEKEDAVDCIVANEEEEGAVAREVSPTLLA